MPATGYLELALAAGRDASFKYLEVRDLKIRRPLILAEGATGRVQVVLAPDGAGFACRMLRWAGDHWQAHATCRLEAEGEEQRASDPVVLPPAPVGPEVPRSVAAHYASCRAVGLDYGPAFQGIRALWSRGEGVARGEVELPAEVDARGYLVHPALLDACLQVLSAALPADTPHAWLPMKLARYRVCEPAPLVRKFTALAFTRSFESESRRTVELSVRDDAARRSYSWWGCNYIVRQFPLRRGCCSKSDGFRGCAPAIRCRSFPARPLPVSLCTWNQRDRRSCRKMSSKNTCTR